MISDKQARSFWICMVSDSADDEDSIRGPALYLRKYKENQLF